MGIKVRQKILVAYTIGYIANVVFDNPTQIYLEKNQAMPLKSSSQMRHSYINLTMSRYIRVLTRQESKAVEALPDLSLPSADRQRAIARGTDSENVLTRDGAKRSAPVHSRAETNRISDSEPRN